MRNILYILISLFYFSCSSDDCPSEMVININDPASVEAAEDCGLSPAEPLGENLWLWAY